jgi:hypothetical protein
MADKKEDRRKFLKKSLGTATGVTLAGIAGVSLLNEESGRNQENPYEYNIDNFKTIDKNLLKYNEETPISIDYNKYFSITIDKNDRLFVSVDKKILVFDSRQTPVSSFDIDESAYCLETDQNSDLYLGMADHIEVFDDSGKRKGSWKSLGKDAIITSLAVTEDFVYAADAGNLVVWKYDKQGNVVAEIGRKDEKKDIPGFIIPSPFFDVEIDPDGFLWAANTGRHSVENYSKDGGIRTSWGTPSMSVEGFAGCCNPSHFVILENGSFVTAEKGIARIKVYNRLGNLEAVVAGPDEFIEGTVDVDLAFDSKQRIFALDNKKKAVRIFSKKEDA